MCMGSGHTQDMEVRIEATERERANLHELLMVARTLTLDHSVLKYQLMPLRMILW